MCGPMFFLKGYVVVELRCAAGDVNNNVTGTGGHAHNWLTKIWDVNISPKRVAFGGRRRSGFFFNVRKTSRVRDGQHSKDYESMNCR